MSNSHSHIAILGGGIVGLATAVNLIERYPRLRVLVLEKEPEVGQHQTGHNSGVLHSGIYYKPGSLRAVNCRTGKRAMEEFCARHGIAHEICGKVIVAASDSELPALARIFERGQQNGVRCVLVGPERLKELEPHAAGVKAIHVPEAGIVNFRQVSLKMADLVRAAGGEVRTSARVIGIKAQAQQVAIQTTAGDFTADHAVSCCGLYSDRVARLAGQKLDTQIVPFRGEYYELKPDAQYLCRNLIYPVPDPSFPFLGVHFTRMIEGGVECGPNAVLAFAREGYRKTDINLRDLCETLAFSGFRKMAWKYWRVGAGEMWRSWSKAAFVRALQHLIPEVRKEHLVPARAGVRAMSIGCDGAMVDDFVIQPDGRVIHVLNAPSPAATSALNIGRLVVDRLAEPLDGK
ncbi:MAG: L-2-hydroxyglutarate oxidase [Planctomycetaceae bacterium]|nr:L-2-hydroxyglutarate oxidase [Planctomycetaceae bacterium]